MEMQNNLRDSKTCRITNKTLKKIDRKAKTQYKNCKMTHSHYTWSLQGDATQCAQTEAERLQRGAKQG